MEPIIPFEPVAADETPKGEAWIAQIKWDGVRMLTYFDGGSTRLVNRRLNERTLQYPEFAHAPDFADAASIILDGEFVAFDRTRPSFHEIMRRDSLRREDGIRRAVDAVPVTYIVFDVLYRNGQWLTDRPLRERQDVLRSVLRHGDRVKAAENAADADALFGVMESHGMEGIVCKDLDSRYLIGGKDKRWRKKKIVRDLIAVVGGVTLGDGGIVNSLLLGLYDEKGDLWYVGHSGTGRLTHGEWRALTARVAGMRTERRPFRNRPEREREAVWVKPVLAVKIHYAEWTEGRSLRQPSIQAFVDAPPESCTFFA